MTITGLPQRSFVVRYLTLFGGEAFGKVCSLVAFSYLARVLGPRDFGFIELAISTTVFFALGAESGLGTYGARHVSASPQQAAFLIPRIGLVRAVLGLTAYFVILWISKTYGAGGIGILAIYGGTILVAPLFTQWVFQGLRQMQWVAAGTALRAALFMVLVFSFVHRGVALTVVALAELSGAAALAVFNTILLKSLKIRIVWDGIVPGALALLRATWYLGVADVAWAAGWYSPNIALGWLGQTEQVAWLGSAVRIVLALHTFVFLYFFNLIPNVAKELHEGTAAWRGLVHRSLSTSMWAACFVALVGVLFAPRIIRLIYGDPYAAAIVPFQIVILMIPITWFSGHFRVTLIAAGRQDLECWSSIVAATTTAVLALVLGPDHGSTGAAQALLAGGIVYTLLAGLAVTVKVGKLPLRSVVAPVAVLLGSWLTAAILIPLFGPAVGVAVACSLYVAVALSQWDIARLKEAWEGSMQ